MSCSRFFFRNSTNFSFYIRHPIHDLRIFLEHSEIRTRGTQCAAELERDRLSQGGRVKKETEGRERKKEKQIERERNERVRERRGEEREGEEREKEEIEERDREEIAEIDRERDRGRERVTYDSIKLNILSYVC